MVYNFSIETWYASTIFYEAFCHASITSLYLSQKIEGLGHQRSYYKIIKIEYMTFKNQEEKDAAIEEKKAELDEVENAEIEAGEVEKE